MNASYVFFIFNLIDLNFCNFKSFYKVECTFKVHLPKRFVMKKFIFIKI
jgi:hypothetical protein